MPKKNKKKGSTPLISTNEKIAREREKYLEGEKEFRRLERERDAKLRADIKKFVKSVGSGVKKFAVKVLSGGTRKAITQRLKNLETMYPKKFIKRR